nr:MAG TPA: hypothetical protein [Caudoviricetes sp.]
MPRSLRGAGLFLCWAFHSRSNGLSARGWPRCFRPVRRAAPGSLARASSSCAPCAS